MSWTIAEVFFYAPWLSFSNESYIKILIDYLKRYIFVHIHYTYPSCRMLNTVINSLPGSSFCRFAYFLFKLPADLYLNCLFILSSTHLITVCVQVCTGHTCHGACVKWQLNEGLLSFYPLLRPRAQTQVARLTGLSPLSAESSCQPSMLLFSNVLFGYFKKYFIILFFNFLIISNYLLILVY